MIIVMDKDYIVMPDIKVDFLDQFPFLKSKDNNSIIQSTEKFLHYEKDT